MPGRPVACCISCVLPVSGNTSVAGVHAQGRWRVPVLHGVTSWKGTVILGTCAHFLSAHSSVVDPCTAEQHNKMQSRAKQSKVKESNAGNSDMAAL